MNNEEIEDLRNNYKIELIRNKFSQKLKCYKGIILGTSEVGKAEIAFRLFKDEYISNMPPILNVDIISSQMKINNRIIEIHLWDVCGNEKFTLNTPNVYKNTSFAIIVYSINNKNSFEDVIRWINILNKFCLDHCITILVGNNNELNKGREVLEIEGEELKNK